MSKTQWENDAELFQLARAELLTAVVGDIMDRAGLQKQFLTPNIRPLMKDMVVIGRAMTVVEADIVPDAATAGDNSVLAKPFGLMLEALDDLKVNEVYVCSGASPRYALWGELMSVRAMQCGAAGAIVDGYSRDTREILNLNFPTFSFGPYAQDQAPRGRVIDFRVSITIGEVLIEPGDILFGDIDGVCVVPSAEVEEVFNKALEKARGEKMVRKAIESGMSAADAFRKFGIM